MLTKGYLIILFCLGVYAARTRHRNRCRDRMLHIAGGRYPCTMLVDRNHKHQPILGAYNNRVALCSKPRYSGCCRTCTRHNIVETNLQMENRSAYPKVRNNTKGYRIETAITCKDDILRIADGSYSCAMLIDKRHRGQKIVGAFKQRKVLCSSPGYSGCCKTCLEHKLVRRNKRRRRLPKFKHQVKLPVTKVNGVEIDSTCEDSGLNIAGGFYDCNLLIDSNQTRKSYLGAYKNRQKLCSLSQQSGCCRTCFVHGLYDGKSSKTNAPRKVSKSQEEHTMRHKPLSYCEDSGLNIADGSYDCSMLIDKKHRNQAMVGAFKARRRLCSRASFSGCCHTCQQYVISKSRRQCKDEYVVVNKNKLTYACRELLQRRSDIYPDRFDLCADPVNTRCCKTCANLAKTKSTEGLIINSNLIRKPGLVEVFAVQEIQEPPGDVKNVDAHKTFKRMNEVLKQMMSYVNKRRPNNKQQTERS